MVMGPKQNRKDNCSKQSVRAKMHFMWICVIDIEGSRKRSFKIFSIANTDSTSAKTYLCSWGSKAAVCNSLETVSSHDAIYNYVC